GEPGAGLGHRREPARPARAGLAPRLRLDPGRAAPGVGPDRAVWGGPGRAGPGRGRPEVREPALRPLFPRYLPHAPPPLVLDVGLRQPDEGGGPRPAPRPPPIRA